TVEVPGYPRYRYAGDSSKGEHHLVIKGVTLQDDGEYQCQVGPTANATAIWAAANVTVLVPPESISINGRRDGAVVQARAGSALTLECLVEKGRPVPRVSWLRNGLKLDPGQQEDEVLASSLSPLLWNVRSRVRLRARVQDDGQRYTCRAVQIPPDLDEGPDGLPPFAWNFTNSADETVEIAPSHVQAGARGNGDTMASRGHSANSSQVPPASSQDAERPSGGVAEPVEVSVVVSVLYPPSRPVITGYQDGDVLSEGESVNLTCTVGAANPRPSLSWHRNGRQLSPRLTDDAEEPGLSNASLPSAGQSIAEVVTVSRQDDGAKYECRVNTSLFSRPLASAVTLNVQYPPSNVTMTGPEVVGSGNTVTFTCVTSPANPPAAVTWTIHGSLTKKSKSTVSRGIEGHWVTTSTLTYRVPRSSNELSIRCLARNEASSTPVVSNKSVQVISELCIVYNCELFICSYIRARPYTTRRYCRFLIGNCNLSGYTDV
ncbi:nephrin-like, partial [Penaeus japonicus]|uniref:nephrin-like n=1 Tax=Penaeus japonicus TaxID=27405 RepID=UPI001C71500F